MKNLSVPYKSQHDSDAQGTHNDCGPASVAMILNYFGENVTTDEVFRRTGAGQGLIRVAELKKAISSYGYDSEFITNSSLEEINQNINKGIPIIALVHYGSLSSRQDKKFTGGHFFVMVGYRDDGFFVNDPNFWGEYRKHGDHHFYKRDEFTNAWSNCWRDGNPNKSYLIILPKEEKEESLLGQSKEYWEQVLKERKDFEKEVIELREANKNYKEFIDLISQQGWLDCEPKTEELKGKIQGLLQVEDGKNTAEGKVIKLKEIIVEKDKIIENQEIDSTKQQKLMIDRGIELKTCQTTAKEVPVLKETIEKLKKTQPINDYNDFQLVLEILERRKETIKKILNKIFKKKLPS